MPRLSLPTLTSWPVLLALLILAFGALAYGLHRNVYTQAYIGAQFSPLTKAAEARTPFLDGGAQLINIVRDGPADVAGITQNSIVTAIDGEPVKTARQAANLLANKLPGGQIVLTIYDISIGDGHPRQVTVRTSDAPPDSAPLTTKPIRSLAQPWFPSNAIVANAFWSTEVSGAIKPDPVVLMERGRCSALAPADWKIESAGNQFLIVSSSELKAKVAYGRSTAKVPEAYVNLITALAGGVPDVSTPTHFRNGIFRVDFGTANGFNGYVLYRVQGKYASVWAVNLPGANVASLLPMASAIALSIRCGAPPVDGDMINAAYNATSLSDRCLAGSCDESDLAGLYVAQFHLGYVHSQTGENFLLDPRSKWRTGPSGAGYYRQIGGRVEKLRPGRTN